MRQNIDDIYLTVIVCIVYIYISTQFAVYLPVVF